MGGKTLDKENPRHIGGHNYASVKFPFVKKRCTRDRHVLLPCWMVSTLYERARQHTGDGRRQGETLSVLGGGIASLGLPCRLLFL